MSNLVQILQLYGFMLSRFSKSGNFEQNLQVEGIQVHADEGGATHTRGGVYWFILPAGCISSIRLAFH